MTWEELTASVDKTLADFIDENFETFGGNPDALLDAALDDDSVTGAACGSWTCNAYQSKANVLPLMFDDRFADLMREAGYGLEPFADVMANGAEELEVMARGAMVYELWGAWERQIDEACEAADAAFDAGDGCGRFIICRSDDRQCVGAVVARVARGDAVPGADVVEAQTCEELRALAWKFDRSSRAPGVHVVALTEEGFVVDARGEAVDPAKPLCFA